MDCKLTVKEPGIISLYMHIYKYVCMYAYTYITYLYMMCLFYVSSVSHAFLIPVEVRRRHPILQN